MGNFSYNKTRLVYFSNSDLKLLNPNTSTCPTFRTQIDKELSVKIYSLVPIFKNKAKVKQSVEATFRQGLFNITSDSSLFLKRSKSNNWKGSERIKISGKTYLPLYEAKMVYIYNNRHGSFGDTFYEKKPHQLKHTLISKLSDPAYQVSPFFWTSSDNVNERINQKWDKNWFIAFRDVTDARASERTVIASIIPFSAVGNNLSLIFPSENPANIVRSSLSILATLNCIVFDYLARQKVGGLHLNFFILEQLPILPADFIFTNKEIIALASELIYTNWTVKAFIDDLWCEISNEYKAAILEQWKSNVLKTNEIDWILPRWNEDFPEIEWEKDGGIPVPPFKWVEGRRAIISAVNGK